MVRMKFKKGDIVEIQTYYIGTAIAVVTGLYVENDDGTVRMYGVQLLPTGPINDDFLIQNEFLYDEERISLKNLSQLEKIIYKLDIQD
jgi:hypothetical protein